MVAYAREELKDLPSFPSESFEIAKGKYAIYCEAERELEAEDDVIRAEVWFKSPVCLTPSLLDIKYSETHERSCQPLDLAAIRKIKAVQLIAESHDQEFCDVPSAGNWTWLELAILEDDSAWEPRVQDGVQLVWKSHYNRFMSENYDWVRYVLFTYW
jgi:hypothetical protein